MPVNNLSGAYCMPVGLRFCSGESHYGLPAPSTDGLKGDRDMSRIHSIFKQSALATALALVTLSAPAAFAQSHHRGDDRSHYNDRHHDHRNDRGDYRD
ncbi:MAG: hypothetical protein RR969_12420, partial [Thermomonas sp.]